MSIFDYRANIAAKLKTSFPQLRTVETAFGCRNGRQDSPKRHTRAGEFAAAAESSGPENSGALGAFLFCLKQQITRGNPGCRLVRHPGG
jgi:hypothetical protein